MLHVLNPIAGWLFVLAAPIIAFYILKVRLRRHAVSTTMFWERVFEEHRTRSLWRRLRHLLSLLVQLLFLCLIAGAVMDPIFGDKNEAPRTVVIVDNSASMNARTPGEAETRLERVRALLKKDLSRLRAGHQTAILTAGGAPRVVVGFTDHVGTLSDALASIEPTDAPTCLAETIAMARHLKNEDQAYRIVVYTDGCTSEIEPLLKDEDLQFVPIGGPTDNVAITRFQPRRLLNDALGYEVLVEVAAFVEEAVDCRLEVTLNGNPIDVIPIHLEPGATWKHVIRSTTDAGGILHASIAYEDALASDNQADAVLPARPAQKLLYYGEDDFFLGHVLVSQPNIEFTRLTECPTAVGEDEVLILHRTIPETLPSGSVLVVDPRTDCDLWRVGESLDMPLVAEQATDSPLLRHVHLQNVLIPGARRLDLIGETGWQVLLKTPEDSPLYLLHEEKDRTVVALTSELKKGDLPLRTAFPIMVAQTLAYFRGIEGELERAYSVGQPVETMLETDLAQLTLRAPDGLERTVAVYHEQFEDDLALETIATTEGGAAGDEGENGESGRLGPSASADTTTSPMSASPSYASVSLGTLSRAGLWTLHAAPPDPESEMSPPPLKIIACNMADAAESNLLDRPDALDEVPSLTAPSALAGLPWFWLTVFAFGLIIVEWYLYQRRWIS